MIKSTAIQVGQRPYMPVNGHVCYGLYRALVGWEVCTASEYRERNGLRVFKIGLIGGCEIRRTNPHSRQIFLLCVCRCWFACERAVAERSRVKDEQVNGHTYLSANDHLWTDFIPLSLIIPSICAPTVYPYCSIKKQSLFFASKGPRAATPLMMPLR